MKIASDSTSIVPVNSKSLKHNTASSPIMDNMRLLKKRKYINFYDTDKIGFSGPYSQMKQVKTATIYLL